MQSMPPAIFLSEHHAGCKIITYPRASIVAQSLTIDWNFARISSCQESARINAFYYVLPPALSPVTGASMRSAIAKLIKFRKSSTIRQKIIVWALISPFGRAVLLWCFFGDEMISASCGPASCSGRQSDGHLHRPCDPTGGLMRCLHRRMTGRIGLRHRDSQGTDTWHTLVSEILTNLGR